MKRILFALLALSLILASCQSKNITYNSSKRLFQMKSYSSIADITVNGNKGISNYRVMQYFIEPDKLRIETIEPGALKGKVMVRNGDKWRIYHPLINQTLDIEKLKAEDELIYMGVIQKSVFSQEDSNITSETLNGERVAKLLGSLADPNQYRNSCVLYIDEKTGVPKLMEILDSENKARVVVKYSDFKYDADIKKTLFNLD